jgi:nicotinamidase/pyrazinamidase
MKALLIVDMQNDFMPGGALPVPHANQIIPVINQLIPKFHHVLATQDWHPKNHQSFAPMHPGKKPGDIMMIKEVEQVLWPVHCVRNTKGAELVKELDKSAIASIIYKGTDEWIDSYSAFFDNARRKSTGLADYLQSRAIDEIYVAGVATDYCVLYSVIDAIDLGFTVHVVVDACKGINLNPGDVDEALATMREKGAQMITTKEV